MRGWSVGGPGGLPRFHLFALEVAHGPDRQRLGGHGVAVGELKLLRAADARLVRRRAGGLAALPLVRLGSGAWPRSPASGRSWCCRRGAEIAAGRRCAAGPSAGRGACRASTCSPWKWRMAQIASVWAVMVLP